MYELGKTKNLNRSQSNINVLAKESQNQSLNETKRRPNDSIIENLFRDGEKLTQKINATRDQRNKDIAKMST